MIEPWSLLAPWDLGSQDFSRSVGERTQQVTEKPSLEALPRDPGHVGRWGGGGNVCSLRRGPGEGGSSLKKGAAFTFTFHFHALEKETATHASVLAWRLPGTGEPDGLLSMESHQVGHDWRDLAAAAPWKTRCLPLGSSWTDGGHTHTHTHTHTCLLFLAIEHQTLWFPGQSWKGLAKVPDSFQEKRTGRRGGVQPLWESFGFGYQQTAWASAPGSLLCCLTTVITLAVFRGLSKTAKLVCVYIFTEASCSSLHTGPSKCTSTHLHVGVTECGNSCLPKCAHTSVCRCTWWGSPFSNTWSVSLPDFSIQQCGDINTVGRTLNWVLPLPCFAKSWRVYPNIRNHPSARSALSPCRTLVCYTRGFPEVLSMSALCSFHWTSVHLVIYSSNSHWASAGPDPVLKVRNTKTSISWPLSSWKAHSSQGERRGHNLSCSKADPGETMAEKEVTTTHICGI